MEDSVGHSNKVGHEPLSPGCKPDVDVDQTFRDYKKFRTATRMTVLGEGSREPWGTKDGEEGSDGRKS